MTGTLWLLMAVTVGIAWWTLARAVAAPVPLERLDEFTQRHQVRLTPTTAPVVMRYLATTYRWRAAGVTTALCYTVAAGLRDHTLMANLSGLFAGWFIGAVVAEWRVNAPPRGTRRQALLVPRRKGTYLGTVQRVLPWTIAALALAGGVAGLVRQVGDPYAPRARTALAVLVVLATITAAGVVGRRIVSRPQAADLDEEVRNADDALRARSLQVLNGSAVALLAMAAAAVILSSPFLGSDTALVAAITVQALGLLAGWYVTLAQPRPVAAVPAPLPG